MPNPDRAVIHARILAVLAARAAFVIVIPIAQGLSFLVFGGTRHTHVAWLAFLGVMSLLGALGGALTYAATARPSGWLRSYLFGVLLVLMGSPDIDEFIRMSWSGFVMEAVLNALIAGILMGAVIHLVGHITRPR